MSWEVDRHDWPSFRAEGSAAGIPAALAALQASATEDEALAAYWRIDNTVVVQGAVHEAALPTVSCLLVSLLRCTDVARPHLLELLVQIGGGAPAEAEVAAGSSDIVFRCLKEIGRGLPIFVSILEHTENSDERAFCVDLLGLCCRVEPALRGRVLWYFDAVKSGRASEGLLRLLQSWREELSSSDRG